MENVKFDTFYEMFDLALSRQHFNFVDEVRQLKEIHKWDVDIDFYVEVQRTIHELGFNKFVRDKYNIQYGEELNYKWQDWLDYMKDYNFKDYNFREKLKKEIEKEKAYISPLKNNKLPIEFDNEETLSIFLKAIEKGFMNKEYSFIGTHRQRAYFAFLYGEKFRLTNKWAIFEKFWNVKNLAQYNYESFEKYGVVPRQKDIDQLFE
ncbi:hypothetical protein TRIP_D440212 [uncultured Paludibacter sp.]|nr:hypothetical protein TRIP_D440212 [uncultured Paludibacter sp.]